MLDVSPFQGWDGWICRPFRAGLLLQNLLLMKRILFSVALGTVLALGFNAWKDGLTDQLPASTLPASDTFEIESDTNAEVALQRALKQQFEAMHQDKPSSCRLPTRIQYVGPACKCDSEVRSKEPFPPLDEEIIKPEVALSTTDSLKDTIYEPIELEKMPQYSGGEVELLKYLRDSIQFKEPDCVPRKGVIRFVVKKNGDLSNFEVLKDPGCGLGETYIELLKKMPKWIPGSINGQLCDVKFTLPIYIRLE
jgi:hypothetical protein